MKKVQKIRDVLSRKTTLATAVLIIGSGLIVWASLGLGYKEGSGALVMIAALATVYIGLLNYWLQRDKMMQELFSSFNKRYDEFNDDLLAISKGEAVANDKDPESRIVDYLNLCGEEYFWYKNGRVDETMWKEWYAGMNMWMNVPAMNAIALQERSKDKRSFYGLFAVLVIKEDVLVSDSSEAPA